MSWPESLQFLGALLVIVDPFFTVPIFLALTTSQSVQTPRLAARLIAFSVFVVLLLAAALGPVSPIIWGAFRWAVPLGTWMDQLTLGIANRLLGRVLAAIAVEYLARGLRALFPVLKGS